MNNTVQFETPENVKVSYEIAGMGSRFLAWIEDQLIVFLALVIVFFVLLFTGASGSWLDGAPKSDDPNEFMWYIFGIITVVTSLGSFFYYYVSELFWRGQTIGKRHNNIRVVKANGYSLDMSSIALRNIFRVLDHFPIMWLVPMMSSKSQRLGDMVAGTVCVKDEPSALGGLRETLLARPITERHFRVDVSALQRLRPQDLEAVERVLEGLESAPPDRAQQLCGILCEPLARRMHMNEPPLDLQRVFLEDVLTAEYRRQERKLG